MEAPRGFVPAFLRVDQAIAPNGGLCRTLKPRLESHPALKSPGLMCLTAAQAPPWPHRASADKSRLGQLASLLFAKCLVVQPACRSTGLALACRAACLLLRPRGVLAFSRGLWFHRYAFRFSSPAPNDGVSGAAAPSNTHRWRITFARNSADVGARRSRVRCTLG